MEIDQAIESLENDQRRNYTEKESILYKAQGLGLEALKRIQKARATLKWPFADRPLPGETIETT